MNFKENVLLALAGLKANKMRAFLTMLGIIIGISSVIMITTLGSIVEKGFTSTVTDLGVSNLVQIYITQKEDAVRSNTDQSDFITMDMIESVMGKYGDKIKYLNVIESCGNGTIVHNRENLVFSLDGHGKDYATAYGTDILRGRYISQKDVDGRRNVCVIPSDLCEKLYGEPKNAIGQTLSLEVNSTTNDFTIIGVFKFKQTKFGGMNSQNYEIDIPYTTAQDIDGSDGVFYYVEFTGIDGIDASKFSDELKNYFNKKFYADNDSFEVASYSMSEQLGEINKYLGIIQLVLSIIAGISLFVGGIGVMNIMLVSVTERTREIGIRKALGAPNSAIRIQFITESVIICGIGGLIGIISGIVLGNIGGIILKQTAVPSIPAIIIAVTFSMAIGIFFGSYPANKAAKLDPIEALRYE